MSEPSTPAVPNPSIGGVPSAPGGPGVAPTALSTAPPLSPATAQPGGEPVGVSQAAFSGTPTAEVTPAAGPPQVARQPSNLSRRSRHDDPAAQAIGDDVLSRKGSAALHAARARSGSIRSQMSGARPVATPPDPMSASQRLGATVASGSALAKEVSQAIVDAMVDGELQRQPSGVALSRHASRVSGLGGTGGMGGTPPEPLMDPPVTEPASVLRPPEGDVSYFQDQLAAKDKRVKSLEQQVEALQRLQAASTMDNTVKVVNEERTRLAARLKDANKEIDTLRATVREKDQTIAKLKSADKGPVEVGRTSSSLRKDLQASSQREADAVAKASELQQQIAKLQRELSEALHDTEGLVEERNALNLKLEQAHAAIIASTQRGHLNEVRLHQARTALHMVVQELGETAVEQVPQLLDFESAAPSFPSRGYTPAAERRACHFHYSPRRDEQISSVRRNRPDGIWRSEED